MYVYIIIMLAYSFTYLVSLFMFLFIIQKWEGKIRFVIFIPDFVQTIVFN